MLKIIKYAKSMLWKCIFLGRVLPDFLRGQMAGDSRDSRFFTKIFHCLDLHFLRVIKILCVI